MSRQISSVRERALCEQLRREAKESCPEFSETLHRQVISAIERHKAPKLIGLKDTWAVAWWRGRLATALAAACVLLVVAFGWRLTRDVPRPSVTDGDVLVANSGGPQTSPLAGSTDVPIAGLLLVDEWADRAVDDLDGLIVSAAIGTQSADLKHDTRLAAQTLLRRLPVDVELLAGP